MYLINICQELIDLKIFLETDQARMFEPTFPQKTGQNTPPKDIKSIKELIKWQGSARAKSKGNQEHKTGKKVPKPHLPSGNLQILNFYSQSIIVPSKQSQAKNQPGSIGKPFHFKLGFQRATHSQRTCKPEEKFLPPSGCCKEVALAMRGWSSPEKC